MKKKLLLIFLLFQSNVHTSEKNKFKKYLINVIAYLYLKASNATNIIYNLKYIKKIIDCIDISSKNLRSDELIIIVPKNENNFRIKLLNLYKIETLKEKFEDDNEWYEIDKELYETIKKLCSSNLECIWTKDIWRIKLSKNLYIKLKEKSEKIEAVILANENLGPIVRKLYEILEIN